MVFDQRGQYAPQWEAIRSIAEKIGCSAEALRNWVRFFLWFSRCS